MKGRKPTPTEQKRLAGNPGCRPLNEHEPQPECGAPDYPPQLGERGVEVWAWLCATLDGMGLLVRSDVALMVAYCDAWLDFWDAAEAVEREGRTAVGERGGRYMNPEYNVKVSCWNRLVKAASELGFSATSRTRIHAAPKAPETDGKGRFFQVVG